MKNLRRAFDKSVVFCARNSVLVKKLTKIFKTNVDKSYYKNFNLHNQNSGCFTSGSNSVVVLTFNLHLMYVSIDLSLWPNY